MRRSELLYKIKSVTSKLHAQATLEYLLLAALIALATIGVIGALKWPIGHYFNRLLESIVTS